MFIGFQYCKTVVCDVTGVVSRTRGWSLLVNSSILSFKRFCECNVALFLAIYSNTTHPFYLRNLINATIVNSLVPVRCGSNFKRIIFIKQNGNFGVCCEIVFWWILQNLTNEKSTLVYVMKWCRQVPSHYLSQCWLGYMSLYATTRPQRVKRGQVEKKVWHLRVYRRKLGSPSNRCRTVDPCCLASLSRHWYSYLC